jgi:hypothetical protein
MKTRKAFAGYRNSQAVEVIETVICMKGLVNIRLLLVV